MRLRRATITVNAIGSIAFILFVVTFSGSLIAVSNVAPAFAGKSEEPPGKHAPPAAKQKNSSGWLLLYDTCFTGHVRARIDTVNNQAVLWSKMGDAIVRPPDYSIGTYTNPDNKSYFVTPRTAFAQAGQNFGIEQCVFENAGTEKVGTLPCTRYKLYQKLKSGKQSHVGDMWTTNELVKSKPLIEALCYTCAAPRGYGLPVKIILKANYSFGEDGQLYGSRGPYLSLLEWKKSTFESGTFDVPPGYKKAKSIDEFLFSLDGSLKKGDLDDLFRKKLNGKN